MKKLLRVAYVVVLIGGIAGGIMYLEDMRKQSAAENRRNTEAALQGE